MKRGGKDGFVTGHVTCPLLPYMADFA